MADDKRGRLFEYAILHHPKATKDQVERGEHPKSEMITAPKTCVAADENQVAMLAARALDEKYVDKLDEIEIIVRPF